MNYKFLLYKAHYLFRHKNCRDCPTWYDGCNCFIPYEEFDNEYYKLVIAKIEKE